MTTSVGSPPSAEHSTTGAAALRRTWRERRGFRLLATILATAVVATTAALTPALSASAALTRVGPISPAGAADAGFPSYYTDANGLSLTMCLDSDPLCLAGADFLDVHASGGDAEAFYWAADAEIGPFQHHNALEATFVADGPDMETVFMRTQVRAKDADLPVGAVYKITDPFGSFNCTVNDEGEIPSNGCRIETTPVELEPERALKGRIGPFLTWDTFADASQGEAPPAGYIGDNATPHKVVGSPKGFNKVRIEGFGVNPDGEFNCSEDYTGPAEDCAETDLFVIQGKLHPGATAMLSSTDLDFGNTVSEAKKSVTFTSTGIGDVVVESVGLEGSADFSLNENCAGQTLAPSASCTIDVTYTPSDGGTDNGTITLVDSTTGSPRTISLSGSSLASSSVDPEWDVAFGEQKVSTSSAPRVVTVSNTGVQPLTVSGAALPTGTTHFALVSNGCAEPVPAQGSCEIEVAFTPKSTGFKSSILTIRTDAGEHQLQLTGSGTAPSVSVSATTVAFGDVPIGSSSTSRTVRLSNNGSATVTLDDTLVTGADTTRFPIGGNTCVFGTNLAVGQSCAVQITFTPGTLGAKSASLVFTADDIPVSVALSGNGVAAADTTAPAAPTAVQSTAVSTTSLTLNWAPASDNVGVVGYRIYRDGVAQALTSVTGTSFTDTGLAAGSTHTYQISAVDAAGNESGKTTMITAKTVAPDTTAPTTPTGVTVTANGTTAINVAWTGSTDNVGVTGYRVYRDGEPTGLLVTGTSYAHTALASGSAHTYQVTAVDAAGNESPRTAIVTGSAAQPVTVPGAPTIHAPTRGDASVTVNWSAPANTGGAPITGYTIRVFEGTTGTTAVRTETVGAVTSTVLTGLTNGTPYTFTVGATNSAGTGLFSLRSVQVTPAPTVTLPGAPTIGTPTAGNASATVNWTAPTSTGGAAITGYSVRVYNGTTSTTPLRTVAVPAGTSAVVTGLTNGTTYTFTVAAVNSAGTGAYSARSASVRPAAPTAPGAPTIGTPTAGNASATVNWTAPTSTGGAAITGYSVRVYNGTTSTTPLRTVAVPAGTSAVVTGLTNGTTYTFTVAAVNSVGTGSYSARSASVRPVATTTVTVPGAPAIGATTAGNASVTVRWTAPASTGGATLTGYSVRTWSGTTLVRTTPVTGGTTTSTVIGTLTNGTAYTFDVAATNSAGTGAYSARTAATTPVAGTTTDTTAPTLSARTPGVNATGVARNSNVTVTFSEAVTGLTTSSITVQQLSSTGTVVSTVTGTMAYNATTRVGTFNPFGTATTLLAANTRYRVTINAGIRDNAGNPLASTNWIFTTGAN